MRAKHQALSVLAVMTVHAILGVGLSRAQAQSGGYVIIPGGSAPSWNGYGPNTGWGGYTATAVRPPAAAANVPNAAAWNRYAPATAWRNYDPGASWRPYTPGAVVQRRSTVRQSTASSGFRPSAYREHGTGRNVFLHKPWLPNHP